MQNDLIRRTKQTVLERLVGGKRRGSVQIGPRWVERTVPVQDGAVVGEILKMVLFHISIVPSAILPTQTAMLACFKNNFNRRGAEQRFKEALA